MIVAKKYAKLLRNFIQSCQFCRNYFGNNRFDTGLHREANKDLALWDQLYIFTLGAHASIRHFSFKAKDLKMLGPQ